MNGICITWNLSTALYWGLDLFLLLCLILFFYIAPIYGCCLSVAQMLHSLQRKRKMYCVGSSKKQINLLLKPPWKLTWGGYKCCPVSVFVKRAAEKRDMFFRTDKSVFCGVSFSLFFSTRVFLSCGGIFFQISWNCCFIWPVKPHILGTYKGLRSSYYFKPLTSQRLDLGENF